MTSSATVLLRLKIILSNLLQKLKHFEMDIHLVDDEDCGSRSTLVARYEGEDADSDQPLMGSLKKGKDSTPRERKMDKNEKRRQQILQQLSLMLSGVVGEFVGTFLLTLVICSVVAASVVTSAHVGLWQVAIICGLGVSISIYTTAHLSDAHLNPAVTLAFAAVRWRTFSWKKIVPYITSQLLGGFVAGAILYGLFGRAIAHFEEDYDIDRGSNNSALSAMLFGEYFPNPAFYNHSLPRSYEVISPLEAMLVEAFCTAVLAFVIFSLTDKQNSTVGVGSNPVIVPMLIGLTVTILISTYAPLTQVGMNPARDFGPRVFAACAGWGSMAIPGPRNGFWVYIIGPVLGAVVGAIVNDWIVSNLVRLSKSVRASQGNAHNVTAESEQE